MNQILYFWPFIKLGLTDVWRHKTRSFLTMLGVVFGVGSVIAMLAVGEGASQQAQQQIVVPGLQRRQAQVAPQIVQGCIEVQAALLSI